MKRTLSPFIVAFVLLWPLACTREGDSNKSVVRIRMPDSSQYPKSAVAFSVNPGGWSTTDPVTLGDVLCYAVAVSGPEDYMSKYQCTQVDGTVVMTPSFFGGPVIPNDTIEMEVPSGLSRTFHIIGFGATSVDECLAFTLTGIPERENMSAPHIIGEKTVDLVPGELTLDIDISMASAVKFNECEGEFFNPDPAVLTISESDPYDYGDKATGSFTDHTFTLENEGGSTATQLSEVGLAAPYSLKGGSWPGTGGTCSDSLGSSLTCTIVVTYAPTVSGTPSDTITVSYNDGYNTATVSRQVTGIASAPAQLTFADGGTYNFGTSVIISTSQNYTLTITNTGDYTATSITNSALSAPFTYTGGTFPGTAGTCGATLAPSASCDIQITYSPVADVTSSDTLMLNFVDGAFPATSSINLLGNGATVASLSISESDPYDFGTRANGSNTDYTFTITNNGETQATAMTGTLTTGTHFDFAGGSYPGGGTCGSTLNGGASCTVVVRFQPVGLGAINDTFDINYNDGLVGQVSSRDVTGTSVTPANITITESDPYDFGAITTGSTATHTFTLTNGGTFTASSLSETGLAGDWQFLGGGWPGVGGTCGISLAGGANCDIVVEFAPSSTGLQTDTIDISYNDGAAAQVSSRDVQGTGLAPAVITITESDPYNYGSLTVGTTANHIFTLTNTGGSSATGVSEIGLTGDWQFTGGLFPGTGGTCVGTIGAGANCDIDVEFAPTVSGVSNDTIVISYNDGASAVSSNRDVTGNGLTPASLTISESDPYNYGSTGTGVPVTHIFVITNTGQSTAITISEIGLAAPFSFVGGYPGAGGNCGVSLAGGANCNLEVEFNPPGVTIYNDTIDLQYNNGVGLTNVTRDVQGTGL